MIVTDDLLLYLSDVLSAQVAERYAIDHKISKTEAARYFIGTKTYQLLENPDSLLALETVEYIMDMLDAEEKNDKARWMAI